MRIHMIRPIQIESESLHAYTRARCERMVLQAGSGTVRLRPEWASLLSSLPQLGRVVCITANPYAALQVEGRFPEYQHFGCRGLFTSETIDLRFCLRLWSAAFAIVRGRESGSALKRSLHFYDSSGEAIHTVVLANQSSVDAFENILEQFVDRSVSSMPAAAPTICNEPAAPFCSMHVDTFLNEWGKLNDTLSFAALLRGYGVTRRHAFLIAQGRFTRYVEPQTAPRLFREIASRGLPVNARIGSPACEQVYRGSIALVNEGAAARGTGDARLHFDESSLAAAWIVTIPTKAGLIESLELHDRNGRQILSLCGARTETGAQDVGWYKFLADIPVPRWQVLRERLVCA